MGNVRYQERFTAGTLTNWVLDQTGGTADVVSQDNSNKLKINRTGAGSVSATTPNFTVSSSSKYCVEFDLYYAINAAVIAELLDASNNVIATCNAGSSNNFVFSTDQTGASSATMASATYKQVVLSIDPITKLIRCYISEDDPTYGSLQQVGTTFAYSGTAISKIRFRADNAKTGIAYVDEVRIYDVNASTIFSTGDSIADGKTLWSTHPAYSGRLAVTNDMTAAPTYQLSKLFGYNDTWTPGDNSTWVANRAFGGAVIEDIDAHIQKSVIDQGAQIVHISVGHNNIYPGTQTLSQITAAYDSILLKLITAGITGKNLILSTVAPSSLINTATTQSLRRAFNAWLTFKAIELGAILSDDATAIQSAPNVEAINASYDGGDGIHLNKAGYTAKALTIYTAYTNANNISYTGSNVLRSKVDASTDTLYTQGYYISISNADIFYNGNWVMGSVSVFTNGQWKSGSIKVYHNGAWV